MKIHKVKIYQEFDAPIAQVWEAFNDHANFGKMMGQNVDRIVDSPDTNNVNGVGSVRLIKLPIAPFEETIRKSEKPTCIEYQISKGTPLHHHYGSMQFKSISAQKTALDYSIEVGSKIPLVGLLIKIALQKGIGSSLKNYAKRLKK
ncbi:MAG: SRPBCC family protein [Sphingobacteriales bacterium]|nr:SRPBCC family protein [Sphingobacteriales bacterium]